MTELETKLSQILEEKQNKIIPENIKKGIQIFNIEGTYEGNSGGVKLFETEEQMQQDPNAKEGDLAVVYREEIKNMTADSQTQFLTFPETVTLPQALTESYSCRLRATDLSKMFEGNIMLDQNSFQFDGFTDTGMIRVSYTSSDGITYTREEFMGDNGELTNPVDLGTSIHCEMVEEWNDNFGYFMQIGGNVFEGLFEYKSYTDSDIYLLDYSTLTYSDKININVGKNIISLEKIKAIINSLNKKDYKYYDIAYDGTYYYILPYIQNASYTDTYYDITNNKMYFTISANAQSDSSYLESPAKIYVVTNTFELDREIEVATLNEPIFKVSSSSKTDYKITEINLNNNTMFLRIDNSSESIKFRNESFRYGRGIGNDVIALNTYISTDTHPVKYKYFTAQNQLTATVDKVYNSIYYGKDGVNEGTLTSAPAHTLDDTNAEVYYKLMQFYDNMEPIKVQNGQTFKNAYFITNSYGDVLLDLSEVTNASNMFNGNKYIVECPELNTSNVTNTTFMFNDCTNLISAPEMDTSKVTAMNFMFAYDTNLGVVPVYDTSNVTTMNDMFYMCPNLSDEALNNIMQMCINTTDKYTKNKTLKALAISSALATRCLTLSNYEAFTAAGWTTGY